MIKFYWKSELLFNFFQSFKKRYPGIEINNFSPEKVKGDDKKGEQKFINNIYFNHIQKQKHNKC